jgi:CheY-like chemotaxis protein
MEHLPHPRADDVVILVVDDDIMIQEVVRTILQKSGYFVLVASDGQEALELSRTFPAKIPAVLTDVLMPNMDGLELRRILLQEQPGIKVLLMSGYAEEVPPNVAYLKKPFEADVLREQIRRLLGLESHGEEKQG